MYRKFSLLLLALVLAGLPLVAFGGHGSWKGTFRQGSLIADGFVTGHGNTDLTITLEASGLPVVVCTNQGGNAAPGQNPARVESTGEASVPAGFTKNGKVEADLLAPNPTITWEQGGCPSSNWTATVTGVFWDAATITGFDSNGSPVFSQTYCLQSTSITPGTPVKVVACP